MARLVIECQDSEGNKVFFESSEKEGKELLVTYPSVQAWLTKNGFTQVKAQGKRSQRPKAKFDGKTCPICGSKVFDNLEKKASGEYSEKSPDFACSNKQCTGGSKGRNWAVWPGQYEIEGNSS